LWQSLYNHDVEIILNGHDHIYERFAPQTPGGTVDNVRGIREFIVGSGGANHTTITTIAANSEVRNADTFGVLKLTLPTSYDCSSPRGGKDLHRLRNHGSAVKCQQIPLQRRRR
jgi:hypothetical protein